MATVGKSKFKYRLKQKKVLIQYKHIYVFIFLVKNSQIAYLHWFSHYCKKTTKKTTITIFSSKTIKFVEIVKT